MITGKEALIALANGEEVEYMDTRNAFKSLGWSNAFGLETNLFFSDRFKFRLKPRTITLNGIEVPTPFEPKEEDQYWYLDSNDPQGYNTDIRNHEEMFSQFKKTAFCQIGLWRTEEEIKQVISGLRQVFGGSHDN